MEQGRRLVSEDKKRPVMLTSFSPNFITNKAVHRDSLFNNGCPISCLACHSYQADLIFLAVGEGRGGIRPRQRTNVAAVGASDWARGFIGISVHQGDSQRVFIGVARQRIFSVKGLYKEVLS